MGGILPWFKFCYYQPIYLGENSSCLMRLRTILGDMSEELNLALGC